MVHALVHQLHDTRRSNTEKSSLPRRGYVPARSSYPVSDLPTREPPAKEPGTEAALTIALAGAYAPPCSDGDDTTTTRPERRSYYGFYLCAEHVQQLGGASPLRNLMEVKG